MNLSRIANFFSNIYIYTYILIFWYSICYCHMTLHKLIEWQGRCCFSIFGAFYLRTFFSMGLICHIAYCEFWTASSPLSCCESPPGSLSYWRLITRNHATRKPDIPRNRHGVYLSDLLAEMRPSWSFSWPAWCGRKCGERLSQCEGISW